MAGLMTFKDGSVEAISSYEDSLSSLGNIWDRKPKIISMIW